jgi:hypothetical protein
MATKRQTKQKSAAEPEPISQTASTPAVAPAKAATRELTPIQQLIADEVAEMLVHGGHKDDTAGLIFAALQNMHQRFYDNLSLPHETPEELRKNVEDLARRDYPDWIAEMRMEWNRNRTAKAEDKVEPKTATECIRANVIDDLRDQFRHFLTEGTPEEHRLMLEILRDQEGSARRGVLNELPLGQAFDYALGNSAPEWVKVPNGMREQVDKYIECLRAADMKDKRPAA